LLDRSDVDAVYIPLPTGIRREWVVRAAERGKHVLCEKPCGVNADDVKAMIQACAKNRVQFMDGVMFMHSARLPLLRQVLDDRESVGDVVRITSQFSFKAREDFLSENIRVSSDLEPLGCLGDLGWYDVRLTLWVMNGQLPERVTGRVLAQHARADSPGAVPVEFAAEMLFAQGVSASFYCSFRSENQQWAVISGTRGYLTVRDFVLPFFGSESAFTVSQPVFNVRGCDFNMEEHDRRYAVRETSNSAPDSQETNMIRNFADIVLAGKLNAYWPDIALKTQRVVDAVLQSARAGGETITMAN
jgi:predicted dehydrogenase